MVVNAGAALLVAAEAASDFEEGARLAEQAIDSGAARQAMERFVSKTLELAPEEVAVSALDEMTRSVRAQIERRREQVSLAELERAISARRDEPAVQRGAGARRASR